LRLTLACHRHRLPELHRNACIYTHFSETPASRRLQTDTCLFIDHLYSLVDCMGHLLFKELLSCSVYGSNWLWAGDIFLQ